MTEQTVFTPTGEVAPVTKPTEIVVPPELTEIVGEGKKYATVDDALKAVPHAQKHIKTLEEELAQIREDLSKRKTTEELLAELKETGISPAPTPAAKQEITPDQVAQLVTQALEQRQTEEARKVNVTKVTSAFTEAFGDKAEENFINIAKEAGLSIANLNSLAATSPIAVLKLAGLVNKQQPSNITHPKGSVNTEAFIASKPQDEISAKVKDGSTQSLVSAWRNAGKKIGKTE